MAVAVDSGALKSEQPDVAGTSGGNAAASGSSTEIDGAKKDKRIDKVHTDTVLNFLLRLACKVS